MAELVSNHGGRYDGAEMNLILTAGADGNLNIGFTLDTDTFLMAVGREEAASIVATIMRHYNVPPLYLLTIAEQIATEQDK